MCKIANTEITNLKRGENVCMMWSNETAQHGYHLGGLFGVQPNFGSAEFEFLEMD